MKRNTYIFIAGLAIVAILVVIGFIKTNGLFPRYVSLESDPEGIMGTDCRIMSVFHTNRLKENKETHEKTEQIIRDIESKLSTYIEASEVSILNNAVTGQKVGMSYYFMDVLYDARAVYEDSEGAFDITVKPLVTLWKNAAKMNKLPTVEEIKTARAISYMSGIINTGQQVWKDADTISIDLGGIAKGYATEHGCGMLCMVSGFHGGFVDIGGDIKCIGKPAKGELWDVQVLNPFDESILMTLSLTNKAVCTSGNYHRYSEIEGKRYSHIIDPRTGYPADAVPSATVIGINTAIVDAWATAMSVLGEEGFPLIDGKSLDVMIVTGTADNFKIIMSDGFEKYIKEKLPEHWEVEIIDLKESERDYYSRDNY